jgi:glucosamine--fructose-6-phosphate aminotransferase (isomerizing)
MSHLEREIAEQPAVVERLFQLEYDHVAHIAEAIRRFQPTFVTIAARGTSDNAARYAQYLFATHLRQMVALATPSVHTLYQASPDLSRALVIGISQSGQSPDVRQVLHDARAQGALTLSITNDASSPLAAAAEHHIPLQAGVEQAVAATKTYTAELAAVAMLVAAWSGDAAFAAQLAHVPAWMQETLDASAGIADWAQRYRYIDRYAVIGRGYNYSTAYEISLKIKELSSIPGEEYSEADFRHGPIAVVQRGFPVLLVATMGSTASVMRDLLAKLRERQAECLVISNDEGCRALATQFMPLPAALPEALSPLAAVLPGQVFAMHVARERGHSLDQPTGLTKVTNTV